MTDVELKKKRFRRRKRILIMKGSEKYTQPIEAKKETIQVPSSPQVDVNVDEKCKPLSKLEIALYTVGIGWLVLFCSSFALLLYGLR